MTDEQRQAIREATIKAEACRAEICRLFILLNNGSDSALDNAARLKRKVEFNTARAAYDREISQAIRTHLLVENQGEYVLPGGGVSIFEAFEKGWNAGKALPQPEQEPFGWYSETKEDFMLDGRRKEHARLKSYTHKVGKYDLALYTTPPARKPLTSEQICDALDKNERSFFNSLEEETAYMNGIRDAEAAHNIKEGGA
jgi:hypothetical protein